MSQEAAVQETLIAPGGAEPPPATPGAVGTFEPGGHAPSPRSPFLWLVILLLLGVGLPFMPIPNVWAARLGALTLAAFYAFVVVRFSSDATRVRLDPVKHVLLLLAVLGLWWVFDVYVAPHAMGQLRALGMAARAAGVNPGDPPSSLLFQLFLARTLRDILLLSAAVLGGALVARLITEPNMLAPICGVIAIIDVWGVLFGGLVAQMLEKAPTVAARAMASPPTLGAARNVPLEFQIPLPDIGAGDYLFLGLLFAAMHTHRMNVLGALRWIIPLIILALWGILFGLQAMPGLLFIGLGAAIPNIPWFRFTADEKQALVIAGGFVLVLAVALGFAAPYIVAAAQSGEPGSVPPGSALTPSPPPAPRSGGAA